MLYGNRLESLLPEIENAAKGVAYVITKLVEDQRLILLQQAQILEILRSQDSPNERSQQR